MVFLAIIVLIVKAPFMLLDYVARRKPLLLLVVAGIIGISLFSMMKGDDDKERPQVEVQKYQEIAPTQPYAPDVFQTISRIYYVAEYRDWENGKGKDLVKYYEYNEETWKINAHPLPVPNENIIKIYHRGGKL